MVLKKYVLIFLFFVSHLVLYSQYSKNQITVLWDASQWNKPKNIEKELEFLSSLIDSREEKKYEFIIFSNEVIKSFSFNKDLMKFDFINNEINTVVYDGTAVIPFDLIDKKNTSILLFSNGKSLLESQLESLVTPWIVITSSHNPNERNLFKLVDDTLGKYINLNEISISDAIQIMNMAGSNIPLQKVSVTNNSKKTISGQVYDEYEPIEGALVRSKTTSKATLTDKNGKFTIESKTNDVLIISSYGKETISLETNSKNELSVFLKSIQTQLGEVTITSNRQQEVEFVETAYGKKNRNAVGIAVETIDNKDFDSRFTNISQALRGKLKGVKLEQADNIATAIVRESRSIPLSIASNGTRRGGTGGPSFEDGKTSQYALFFLDGVPLPRFSKKNNVNYDFIDPNNIKDVTVLKGLAATNRFGSLGSSGVILITTFTGDTTLNDIPVEKKTSAAVPKLKKYKGSLNIDSAIRISEIDFKKKYARIKSYEDYLSLKASNTLAGSELIAISILLANEGDSQGSRKVLSNLLSTYPKNSNALRSGAFVADYLNHNELAVLFYETLFKNNPQEIQNKSDLAIALGLANKHNESVSLFKNLLNPNTEIYSYQEARNIVSFKNLLRNRNQSWNLSGVDKNYFLPVQFDLRIEIEWSNPNTRFQFNIVKPNKDLLFYNRTNFDDVEFSEQLFHGVLSKEINYYKAEKGSWYFFLSNLQSVDSRINEHLKVKLIKDFGRNSEVISTFVIPLDESNNDKLFTKVVID